AERIDAERLMRRFLRALVPLLEQLEQAAHSRAPATQPTSYDGPNGHHGLNGGGALGAKRVPHIVSATPGSSGALVRQELDMVLDEFSRRALAAEAPDESETDVTLARLVRAAMYGVSTSHPWEVTTGAGSAGAGHVE